MVMVMLHEDGCYDKKPQTDKEQVEIQIEDMLTCSMLLFKSKTAKHYGLLFHGGVFFLFGFSLVSFFNISIVRIHLTVKTQKILLHRPITFTNKLIEN